MLSLVFSSLVSSAVMVTGWLPLSSDCYKVYNDCIRKVDGNCQEKRDVCQKAAFPVRPSWAIDENDLAMEPPTEQQTKADGSTPITTPTPGGEIESAN